MYIYSRMPINAKKFRDFKFHASSCGDSRVHTWSLQTRRNWLKPQIEIIESTFGVEAMVHVSGIDSTLESGSLRVLILANGDCREYMH